MFAGARTVPTRSSRHGGRQALGDAQERRDRRGHDRATARCGRVDTGTASMSRACSCCSPRSSRPRAPPRDEIVTAVERRIPDSRLYVVLETLEYLKRGGRISGARAALGTMLAVKPIITIEDGIVESIDKVRTRSEGARAAAGAAHGRSPSSARRCSMPRARTSRQFADELAARANLDRVEPSRSTSSAHRWHRMSVPARTARSSSPGPTAAGAPGNARCRLPTVRTPREPARPP